MRWIPTRDLLEKYFKIYSHESANFLWISLISFSIFFVTALFRNYVDTAFLKRFGASYIPTMLVINAGLTFVFMALMNRLGRRFQDYSLLAWSLAGYSFASISIYIVIKGDYGFVHLVYPVLYQLLYLLDSILLVYLWNIAGDLFDARQGKRVFPMITAAQVLGSTLGSFFTKPFTLWVGQDAVLLLFGFGCLAVAVYLSLTASGMFRAHPTTIAPKSTAKVVRLREIPELMKRYPVIRYLIITGLIPNILLPIFFYQFSVISNATFTTEQSLIGFLSVFRGVTTFTTFVLLFFVGRVYTSLGIANSSLIQPLNFALVFGGLTASFHIVVAAYGQFSSILVQRAIAGPVNKILYSIIPGDLAIWSRTFIRGTVLKVGMLTGSLTMIILRPVISVRMLAVVALVPALYWIWETWVFRRRYKTVLKQVIVEKQIDFDHVDSMPRFDSGGAAMDTGALMNRTPTPSPVNRGDSVCSMTATTALRMLSDGNCDARAEAAVSFVASQDLRAVSKLTHMLDDPDDEVRKAAIEALTAYGEKILPFLEVCLMEAAPRTKQSILEVIRLSGMEGFEIVPFLGKELASAYNTLIHYRCIDKMNGSLGVSMLKQHLIELNEETLRLVFYALWVNHADMRLMYQALKSETASIAIELIETSIRRELIPYLLPLIDDIPVAEKIERGRKVLPLVRYATSERVMTLLVDSEDPLSRMLALFVIAEGEAAETEVFIPIIESRLNDKFAFVRDVAQYAIDKSYGKGTEMPDIVTRMQKLKEFNIFEGMGVRELHAIASVLTTEIFEPGVVMIRQGEENSSIYLIVSGKIAIFDNYGEENRREKATLGAGNFLGELSLFTGLPPNATCVATEQTQAYILRHHQFQEIMRVYPQIGINLCRFFTLKLRQVQY